jgi:predicted transposase YdaD
MSKPKASKARFRQMVRQFPENGTRLLLETPANVRELLEWTGTELVELIDFDRLVRSPATFVARDFRHVEADLVLEVPVRRGRLRGRVVRSVLIYILIEHQSEPDELIIFRVLEYVFQIYNQRKQAEQPRLLQMITEMVHTDLYRRESVEMAKTMADVLREEGRREGRREGAREERRKSELRIRQQTLLRLLRGRFGELPPEVVQAVESTQDVEQLDFWLDRFVTARSLDEMEIIPPA